MPRISMCRDVNVGLCLLDIYLADKLTAMRTKIFFLPPSGPKFLNVHLYNTLRLPAYDLYVALLGLEWTVYSF